MCVLPLRLHQWPNDVNTYAFHRCLRLRLDVVLRLRWNLTLPEQTFVTSRHPLSDGLCHAFPHKSVAHCSVRFVFACMMQNGLVAMEQAQDSGDHPDSGTTAGHATVGCLLLADL